ncbi:MULTISPECIES: alpha/beta hydrolase [unclassified Leptospira]|uniref:alpha/beta hydrolase n=1 Tax=unclassified Leptospira TaxID=2633828 RepID=UPI0002BDD316|nr:MULTISPECIES: alpha/beta hydrolase [unclassified Leptospira]EMK01215.1 alpha/beta hydrolase, PF05990 family [Leptospira sp. B5-022]MCR1795448.1 alpha/beta hydrolase [Leptospira sp. id769339]
MKKIEIKEYEVITRSSTKASNLVKLFSANGKHVGTIEFIESSKRESCEFSKNVLFLKLVKERQKDLLNYFKKNLKAYLVYDDYIIMLTSNLLIRENTKIITLYKIRKAIGVEKGNILINRKNKKEPSRNLKRRMKAVRGRGGGHIVPRRESHIIGSRKASEQGVDKQKRRLLRKDGARILSDHPLRESFAAQVYFPEEEKVKFAKINVFFATDREYDSSKALNKRFGSARSELKYGHCTVSIPHDHRMGELESASIFKFQFKENPQNHVVLMNIEISSFEDFIMESNRHCDKFSEKKSFIFIHGFNVTFTEAARRTAQIAYDLGFDGAPIFYSWPSKGKVSGYVSDENDIEWTKINLNKFLLDYLSKTNSEKIYIIAHSMGSRVITRALMDIIRKNQFDNTKIKEVILSAPDIDADIFKKDIAPFFLEQKQALTIYASSKDKALKFSKKVNGYPRLGDSGAGLVVLEGIETIDASNVDTDFMGHSYFAESKSILSDMYYLIKDNVRAGKRFSLEEISMGSGKYWKFKK